MNVDLLVVGNHSKPTGFARVLNALSDKLSEHINVLQYDIDRNITYTTKGRTILGNQDPNDYFGLESLEKIIASYRPNTILVCHDAWFLDALIPIFEKHNCLANVLYYCPIDEEQMVEIYLPILTKLRTIVFYNTYILDLYIRIFHSSEFAETSQTAECIGHGLDQTVFYQQNRSKLEIRKELFPNYRKAWDAFLFFNGNRNIHRKRLDRSLEAFAQFKNKHETNSMLILFNNTFASTFDIKGMAKEFGIQNDILLIEKENALKEIDDQYMNNLYNAVDVSINTAEAEGWGLVSFEAASSGATPLIHNTGIQQEIWKNSPPLLGEIQSNTFEPTLWADMFQKLYTDKQYYSQLKKNTSSYVQSAEFNWANIAKQWMKLIKNLTSI